jgi:hypothetical protein
MLYSNPTTTVKQHAATKLSPDAATDFDSTARQTFYKDMGLTAAEFERALRKAVEGVVTRSDEPGPSFRVDDGERVVFIHCLALPNRRLGSLSLPRLDVEIELRGFDDAATARFFNRFDLAFLRMGG